MKADLIQVINNIPLINTCTYVLKLFFVLDCLQENKNIGGAGVTDVKTHTDVSNLEQCKGKHCQANADCLAFVYDPTTKVCDLKNIPNLADIMNPTLIILGDEAGKTLGLDKIKGTDEPVCTGK